MMMGLSFRLLIFLAVLFASGVAFGQTEPTAVNKMPNCDISELAVNPQTCFGGVEGGRHGYIRNTTDCVTTTPGANTTCLLNTDGTIVPFGSGGSGSVSSDNVGIGGTPQFNPANYDKNENALAPGDVLTNHLKGIDDALSGSGASGQLRRADQVVRFTNASTGGTVGGTNVLNLVSLALGVVSANNTQTAGVLFTGGVARDPKLICHVGRCDNATGDTSFTLQLAFFPTNTTINGAMVLVPNTSVVLQCNTGEGRGEVKVGDGVGYTTPDAEGFWEIHLAAKTEATDTHDGWCAIEWKQ